MKMIDDLVIVDGEGYKVSLMKAMSSLVEFEKEHAVKYLNEFSKSKKIKTRRFSGEGVLTYGKLAAIIVHKKPVMNDDVVKLESWISRFDIEEEPVAVKTLAGDKKKPSIQDALKEKAHELIGELEGKLDDAIQSDNYQEKITPFFKSVEAGAPYMKFCQLWIQKLLKEFDQAKKDPDPEFRKAYDHIPIPKMIKMLNTWLEETIQYTQQKKANRTPRKRKPVPASRQIAKMKYLKEFKDDSGLILKSVSPTSVIGAEQVWLYNPTKRKLTVYRADGRNGLSCKGTTLQGWDPLHSETRTLRDPQKVLKKVIEQGKVALRKVMTDLTTKKSLPNGRTSDDLIILRTL